MHLLFALYACSNPETAARKGQAEGDSAAPDSGPPDSDPPDSDPPDSDPPDSGAEGGDSGADSGATDSGGLSDSGGGAGGGGDGGAHEVPGLVAGFRSSPYGQHSQSDEDYWVEVGQGMADRFEEARPGGIWILGVAGDDGTCYLSFPSPGGDWEDIGFSSEDANEAALNRFDEEGLKVWLQVEPGEADVADLIELVMDRYGHHESVIGFGVDVEWFRFLDFEGGKAVTDAKAADWRALIQAGDPDDRLMLKHWLTDRMPPTEREDILFVNDGQGVGSRGELIDYFAGWGAELAPAAVGYQYGYETDQSWWEDLDDPPGDIGQAALDEIPNTEALYWVDFTIEEVFPP